MKLLIATFFLVTVTLDLNAQSDSLKFDSMEEEQTGSYELVDPIETMPKFPGGMDSLKVFVERNNNWQVGQETILGIVYVGFVVELDGSITNIEIMKGLHESCDVEAVRIINLMPKWKPAELQGKPIRKKMIVPITFDGMK